MDRLKIIKGNLDFVTLERAAPGDHSRGCYFRADEVEAHARLVLLLAGDPDSDAALARIVLETRKLLGGKSCEEIRKAQP